jgi:site-specific DNA recombinase
MGEESVNGEDVIGGNPPMNTGTAAPITNPLGAFAEALTPKVAVSYLRVSTRDQASRGGGDDEGFSIPAQREANKRKAASLGAIVLKEFVDRGASARSANRPELQRMLEYLSEHPVDYVIVHKLDRLARSRVDDIEITQALAASKVQLVSTTESIDETPSGMLLHGIMSSIAEFYSRNLAAEVLKGMTQKARSGGTIGRAPLGYRNHRIIDSEGRELRTVILDEERAPLVRQALTLYATGDWSIASLAEHLNKLGLTTAPTPKMPSKPITDGLLHKVFTNPYYKGTVKFQDVHYPGRHEPLVDETTWQKVQDVIASHVNGERTRRHPHYLKSSLFCGNCGERLLVQIATSGTGVKYPYFMCAGRHSGRTRCLQKSVLIYEVEKKITSHYQRITLDPEFRIRVEAMIREGLKDARTEVENEQHSLKREQDKLERQRDKLMEAHYAGAIPVDLLGREQERIATALRHITVQLAATSNHFDAVERNLHLALDLTERCGEAYEAAPEHIKRMFNQALFEKILVIVDDTAESGITIQTQLRTPFDTLLGTEIRQLDTAWQVTPKTKEPADSSGLSHVAKRNPGRSRVALTQVNSLSKTLLVGDTGLEPMTSSV